MWRNMFCCTCRNLAAIISHSVAFVIFKGFNNFPTSSLKATVNLNAVSWNLISCFQLIFSYEVRLSFIAFDTIGNPREMYISVSVIKTKGGSSLVPALLWWELKESIFCECIVCYILQEKSYGGPEYSIFQSNASQWKELTPVIRSLWERQGICGSIMSLGWGIKPVTTTLSPTGFLLASSYYQYMTVF